VGGICALNTHTHSRHNIVLQVAQFSFRRISVFSGGGGLSCFNSIGLGGKYKNLEKGGETGGKERLIVICVFYSRMRLGKNLELTIKTRYSSYYSAHLNCHICFFG
jgi:hypothetical protein